MSATPISLERYRNAVCEIYKLLEEHPDGLNTWAIHTLTGYPRSTIYIVLHDNPLFHVDRWELARNKSYTQIWCAAEMKRYEDCPMPENT